MLRPAHPRTSTPADCLCSGSQIQRRAFKEEQAPTAICIYIIASCAIARTYKLKSRNERRYVTRCPLNILAAERGLPLFADGSEGRPHDCSDIRGLAKNVPQAGLFGYCGRTETSTRKSRRFYFDRTVRKPL